MKRVLKFLIICTAAALALMPLPRDVVERVYARGVYPVLQPRLTALTNRTPIAWLDVMAVLAGAVMVWMWIFRIRRRGAGTFRLLGTIGGLLIDTASVAAVIYLWFLAAWGLN